MKVLRTADRVLTAAVEALLALIFAAMLGLAALQVFLRFFFHTGLPWADVAARHAVLWVGFFGAYLATREEKHFHIDALLRNLRPRLRSRIAAGTNLLSAVVCGYLLRASWGFLTLAIDPENVLFLGIPEKWVAAIVPAGFALLTLEFLARAIRNLVGKEEAS